MLVVLEVMSKVGKIVRLDEERWEHVREHPEMKDEIDRLREAVVEPDEVRRSVYDAAVWLFYRYYRKTPVTKKYLLAVVRIQNEEGFIVTAFFTDTVKKGDLVWSRKH